MTTKMTKMTPNQLLEWEIARRKCEELNDLIIQRIDEVITVICDFFGAKRDTWYFSNAPEGEVGQIEISFPVSIKKHETGIMNPDSSFHFCLELKKQCPQMDLWDFDYSEGFPCQFLQLDDAEIVQALTEHVAISKKKEKEAEEKAAARKAKATDNKSKIAEQALAKLTPAERKALKLS